MGVGVDGAVKHVSKKKTREGHWFNNQYLERAFYKKNCCGFFNNQSLSNYKQFVMK